MTTITNSKTIADLDQIINDALAAKQALADAKIDALLTRIEQDCAELGITPKQLLANFNTRKRRARRQADDAATED